MFALKILTKESAMKKVLIAITALTIALWGGHITFNESSSYSKRVMPEGQGVILSYYDAIKDAKKSVVNKLKRASKTFQHFKNLIYLCAAEYYHTTKDIKPFLSKTFLEKFVKGRESYLLRMKR